MKCSRLLLLIGLFVALCATPSLAQDGDGKTQDKAEYTLGEVVVSDSSSVLEKSTTVTEITGEELKNAGALTLADAFKMVPGVTTRTAADGTCRIDIRGMRTRNIKLLLNGIPFQSVLDGQFDPDAIPVENIARIKITRGASSVLYGNDGNAGVIDIITKKGTKDFKGTAGAMAGQGDLYKLQTTIAGGMDKLDYYMGASYLTRNGYPVSSDFDNTLYQDSDLRKNSDREHVNVLGNMTYQASDSTSFGAVLNLFEGEYGKPPSTIKGSATDPFAKTPKYERVLDYSGADAQLAMNHEFNKTVDTRLMIYASREYNETSRYDDDNYDTQTKKGSFHSKSTSTTLGLNNQWGYNTDSFGRFVLGLIGERQNWSENGFTRINNTTSGPLDADETLSNYVVALQDDVSPLNDLQVSLGLSLNGQARSYKTLNTYSYVLAANYQLFEGTNIKASQARKIRNPSIQNLYDSVAGNADLTNEINWLYEVGISQALPLASTLDFTVFRNDSENYIEKVGDVYQNHDKYLFQGFETTLSSRLAEGLSTQLGYTYLDSQNLSDDAQTHKLQYRPRHKITAQGTWVAPTKTTIFAGWRFFSDQWTIEGSETKHMPDYGLVDIKISQAFTDALSVYVGADNLFDVDYEESYGFARPGRVVYTGLDYTF
ncbi:TonB-dependent receptor [Pseudodesulfovibrio mercurii]|uniref:TonB-dependent receptor n=1 Tax=Pseudodesulfovibrio mercurii TaxID=641491 RepID=F0JDT8_9BACT|nr:TonB-dependent receptor [Pseudodesulfovibrio mercurii]EGB14620.1 TonB-dependent receptor [Pseudodesulfovibrio mercurii]